MCSFESGWLRDCLNDFKSVLYRCYVDDILLFCSLDHAHKFKEYLSSKHPNIFFRERERWFAANVHRQKAFSVVYTSFKSFIPETENWLN